MIRKPLYLVFIAALNLLLLSLPANAQLTTGDEREALAAAEQFLSLVDDGQFGESWDFTAGIFQRQVSQEKWVTQLRALRPLFGAKIRRELTSASGATSLAGAPDGEYVLLRFESSFAQKKEAIETVTMVKDGQRWQVAGYFIR